MNIQMELDFLKISSYQSEIKSSGTVRLIKDISAIITGRDVLVIEDIVDSGLSVKFLKTHLSGSAPASVRFATLLRKPDKAVLPFDIDYVGFDIGNEFVVGFGLDLDQKMRNLASIYVLDLKEDED